MLNEAIKRAGGQVKLAKAIKSSQASISLWKRTGKVPAAAAKAIEKATGIPRAKLRPDIFT